MGIYESSDRSIPPDTETYYETVASQEEVYIEETEEELRITLTADSPGLRTNNWIVVESHTEQRTHWRAADQVADANGDLQTVAPVEQQLDRAAEQLITGDSDDAPLSEDVVEQMLQGNPKPRLDARPTPINSLVKP